MIMACLSVEGIVYGLKVIGTPTRISDHTQLHRLDISCESRRKFLVAVHKFRFAARLPIYFNVQFVIAVSGVKSHYAFARVLVVGETRKATEDRSHEWIERWWRVRDGPVKNTLSPWMFY